MNPVCQPDRRCSTLVVTGGLDEHGGVYPRANQPDFYSSVRPNALIARVGLDAPTVAGLTPGYALVKPRFHPLLSDKTPPRTSNPSTFSDEIHATGHLPLPAVCRIREVELVAVGMVKSRFVCNLTAAWISPAGQAAFA